MIAQYVLRARSTVKTHGYLAPGQYSQDITVLEPGELVTGYRTDGYDRPGISSWLISTVHFPHVVEVDGVDVHPLQVRRVVQQDVPEQFHQYLFPDHRGMVTLPGYRRYDRGFDELAR